MNDLSAYAAIADRLAHLVIQPDDFPAALADHTAFDGRVIDPSLIRTIIRADDADQPFEIVDRTPDFDAYALPEGYRHIGLWLLHLLFSGRDWAGLELTQPGSRAHFLYAQVLRRLNGVFKLQAQGPARFSGYIYRPQQVWRHPFASADMTPIQRLDHDDDRPFFAFGWGAAQRADEGQIPKADQVILQATPTGIAAMAGLMFDMAHPTLCRNEVNMEPPHIGLAGTQPRSIEARFWLPGFFAFYAESLSDLSFPPFR